MKNTTRPAKSAGTRRSVGFDVDMAESLVVHGGLRGLTKSLPPFLAQPEHKQQGEDGKNHRPCEGMRNGRSQRDLQFVEDEGRNLGACLR